MPLIEVYRAGALVDQIRAGVGFSSPTKPTIISLSAKRIINGVDGVDMTLPSARCVFNDDVLKIYDGAAYVGVFEVQRSEPILGQDNNRSTKYTAAASVGVALTCTSIPSDATLTGATIGDLMTKLEALTFSQTGVVIQINAVGGAAAISADGIKTEASNGVEALRDLLGAASLRWRCRPDLGNVVEYGDFGTLREVTIREANNTRASTALATKGIYIAKDVKSIIDSTDRADVLLAQGGKFSLSDGNQIPLTLRLADMVPTGYEIVTKVFLGETYYCLQRVGNIGTCHKPFVAANILPDGSPPSPEQEKAAANTLAAAAAEYLSEFGSALYNFSANTPFSLTGKCAVGDKVNFASKGLNCDSAFAGPIYLTSHVTTWGSDNTVNSEVELSTRLESLVDPLSQTYGSGAKGRRLTDTRTSFTVSDVAIGAGVVIPFGTTYSSAPNVTPLPGPGCTAILVSVTQSNVTLSSTIAPLPCTVSAIIYPP